MALQKNVLAKDIKKAFDDAEKAVKKNTKLDYNWEVAKRLAAAIDKYIRAGDVKVMTDTPDVKINMGQMTSNAGTTITQGQPVPMSTRGTGDGKVV